MWSDGVIASFALHILLPVGSLFEHFRLRDTVVAVRAYDTVYTVLCMILHVPSDNGHQILTVKNT